jgi:tetratricopeptide (TPR) repeat protein
MDADCLADAADRLALAATLTGDRALIDRIEMLMAQKKMSSPELEKTTHTKAEDPNKTSRPVLDESADLDFDETEVFAALVNSLSPEEQEAYPLYGASFIRGFLTMNQGDFSGASTAFKKALEENSNEASYIHLELATCLVNLDDGAGAKDLAIKFLETFPTSLRGWQILGEALWSLELFDEALDRFAACPSSITKDPPMEILRGETLVLSNRINEARTLYQGLVNAGNRDEAVLRNLAMACERLGENNAANELYLDLINHCSSCGARPDDTLRLRFAETAMAIGQVSHNLLDIYLDLAVKDAENKAVYFKRVSEIYAALGNENQAKRFRDFSLENTVKELNEEE